MITLETDGLRRSQFSAISETVLPVSRATAFLEVLTGSLFPAPVYRKYGSMIAADKFEPAAFKLPLGFKDDRLIRGPHCVAA